MANKAFGIQGADLTLGGVNLQAGTTGVVIPGVTQATNYRVEEVDETSEQTNPLNLPIVIDNVTHAAKVANAGANVSAYATYTVQLDGDDYIEELDVNTAGTYVGSEVDRNADFDMWGYTGSDAVGYLTNWVTGDWVQIPFRPKMRAGDVENVGGGGSLEDIQVNRDDEEGFTDLELADKDFNIRTTRSNPGQDADIGIYAADDLWLEAGGDVVEITAADEVRIYSNNADSSHEWIFNASGHVVFPDGSVQVTAYTGTGDDNIWIETFASDAPSADFVQGATSVEYDADGNVIALFSHYEPGPDSSYTSVAKLTPTGAVLWQVRFGANLNTDGWGLAYDTMDNIVYVAGRTSGTPLTYEFATLTKLNGTFGNIIWSKTYDFEANSTSLVVDVDGNGNPVMVGYSYNGTDNYIITTKVDSADGSVIWSKTLDGQGDEQAYGMAVGPSNEIVTIGYADRLGATDAAATLYTDPVSNPNWTQTASVTGGSGATYTVSFTDGVPTFTNINDPVGGRTVDSILDTLSGMSFGGTTPADDMIVKVGTLAANDTNDRMIVVKYATDGTIAWQKAIQFDAGYDCRGADADIDSNGNIYVCGQYQYDYNSYTTSAMSLVKFNSSGVKQWSRRVVGNCDTFGTSVVVGDDDQLYLSGITGTDNTSDYTWVVAKYNTDGVVTWQRLIDNTTTWTFGGSFWFSGGGGSNIAVKSGYVALAGAFGDIGTQPIAVVLQIDADATPFSVGDWDFKGASFSGVLNGTASDITVVDANKPVAAVSPAVGTFASGEDTSNFLTVTRYGGDSSTSSLINGAHQLVLEANGALTLPAGGTITEGYVTSNPTIQLTPATPTVASQKLVIKGGSNYVFTDNGIEINYNNNTALVGDTLTFYVYSNTYADQTLYWWIYPQGAGIGDTESDTVVMEGSSGMFSILIDSDDYEFTVRVSPEADNYDPANVGVETGLINADSPTFDADHHLHLTTGNLTETSIFLGTDNHNVRTTVNGGIEITTPNEGNNVWKFDASGQTTFPTLTVPISDNATPNGTGQTLKFSDSTQQAIIFGPPSTVDNPSAERIIIQGAPGYTDTTGEGGDVYVWAGPGGSAGGSGGDIKVRAGRGIGSGGGGYLNFQAGDSSTGYGGYINIESGEGATDQGGNIDITARNGGQLRLYTSQNGNITLNTAGGSNVWTLSPTGTTTLPGALVKSTVAKTGVVLPTTTGVVDGLSHNSVLGGLTDGTYGPFTLTGVILSVVVFGGVINGFSNVSGAATVNDVLGTIDSGDIGGTAGTTITITVASVVQATPTALDLTKTVNKLTTGYYTLADGTEGQIMHLVRQTGTNNATVIVANARVAGDQYTALEHYPFTTGDINMLSFTDGAWQAMGGTWD